MRKHVGLAVAAGLAAFAAQSAAAEKLKIGFLPGVVDPFYQVMQIGVEKAAKEIGAGAKSSMWAFPRSGKTA